MSKLGRYVRPIKGLCLDFSQGLVILVFQRSLHFRWGEFDYRSSTPTAVLFHDYFSGYEVRMKPILCRAC